MKRFALLDLLKSLYSDTKILSKYIPYLKPLPSNWETILSTYGLDQLVYDPTRVTSKSVTLIDYIYTSRPEEVMQVRVSTYCPGDHYPVSCSVKYGKSNKSKPRVNKHTVIRYRNLKNYFFGT
jgi:hypothetical protein